MPDSPHIWHFYNLMRLPQKIEGVYLLRGMEANVLNTWGDLDFTRQEFERIQPDWVIASIHSDTLEPGSYSQKDFDRAVDEYCGKPMGGYDRPFRDEPLPVRL